MQAAAPTEVHAGKAARLAEQQEAFGEWVFRRSYAILLACVLILGVQNMRELLPILGNGDGIPGARGSALCSDILEVANNLPAPLTFIASWLHMLARWRRNGESYALLFRHWLSTTCGILLCRILSGLLFQSYANQKKRAMFMRLFQSLWGSST